MSTKLNKRHYWIAFGILSILLRWFFGANPAITEQVYSRGIFQFIRLLFDYTIGWLPIPFLYLLILFIPVYLIKQLIHQVKQTNGSLNKVYELVLSLLAFVGGVVGLFLWLWGYNYARVSIEEQMGIELKQLTNQELKQTLDIHTSFITNERVTIPHVSNSAVTESFIPENFEEEIQRRVVNTMLNLGYPARSSLAVRKLFAGCLLRIGTAGFYLPFTGECNVDHGLHPLQIPYVMAHEMAHGFGIGDEGSCNFIAYLSCIASDDPFIRYSGYLSFWRTLAVNYRAGQPDDYKDYRAALPAGIIADLNAINQNNRKYPDIFPTFRDMTYNTYLKTQGISEGMANYDRVIVLIWGYQRLLDKEKELNGN